MRILIFVGGSLETFLGFFTSYGTKHRIGLYLIEKIRAIFVTDAKKEFVRDLIALQKQTF